MQSFRHIHRVPYHQCTIGNHIYYARYLDILEEARGAFFRSLGFSLLELQEQDLIFPVTQVQLKYFAPARYDDLLEVEVAVTHATRVRVTVYCAVRRGDTLLVEGQTSHVCTTRDEKPKRMPVQLAEKLVSFVARDQVVV